MSIKVTAIPTTNYRIKWESHRHPGEKRANKFWTLHEGLSRLAWWMIFDKYGNQWGLPEPVACECNEPAWGNMEYPEPGGPDVCPLHHRKTGYYARLHQRLVRYLTARWEAEP